MPSKIKKRDQIRWLGRVQKDGQIRQKICRTKQEALAWEAEQRKTEWETTDTTSSLGQWAQNYLDYAEKFAGKTYGQKKKTFKEFFAAKGRNDRCIVAPGDDVKSLTPAKVLAILQVQFRQRSGYAANKDRKNLVAAWNWGIKYHAFPTPNPCLVDRFPEQREPRYVPPEEDYEAVLEQASGQDRVMLVAFLHLAARRSELFRLTWADVDFGRDRIRLSTRKRLEGSLEYDWLPMTGELKSELLWWWENRKYKQQPFVFVCEDEMKFCREHIGKPFTNRQHFMRRLCQRAGVEPFGFHAIRHLTASILYRLGQPVGVIQSILRHKNPTTTERYLRSLGLEETRKALESLGARKGGKVVQMRAAQG